MKRPAIIFSTAWLLVSGGCCMPFIRPTAAPAAKDRDSSIPAMAVPTAANDQSLTIPGLNLTMIRLAPGTFTMGHPGGNGAEDDETVLTQVTFTKGCWLGATEVTIGQWRQFADATGYRTTPEKTGEGMWAWVGPPANYEKQPGTSWRNPGRVEHPDENLPVSGVNWDDTQAFCAWLTQHEREAGRLPAGYVFSLPTEAQWEYACKAGTGLADPPNADEIAWHGGNSGMKEHPVAQKKPNAWGFYDMVGNLWEWCQDWYGPFPGGSVTDYAGAEPAGGTKIRNIRGNSFSGSGAHNTGHTNRWGTTNNRDGYRETLGFRVALVPKPPAK